MQYVDWVDRVLAALDRAVTGDGNAALIGVGIEEVLRLVGVPLEDEARQAVVRAGNDLELVSCAEAEHYRIKVTTEGQRIARAGGLRKGWRSIFERYVPLEEDGIVLQKIVELGVHSSEHYASTSLVEMKTALLAGSQGSDQGSAIATTKRLEKIGCLHSGSLITGGGHEGKCLVLPSYVGIVIATERIATEERELLDGVVADWETTGVEVKEVLELSSDRQKAEFCKDILALANTLVSGRRFLVLGYNNSSRSFTTTVDAAVDAHRMESLLSAYCDPVPQIRYSPIATESGVAGLIEVLSNRRGLPYKLVRDIWKFKAGSVFVRHNTLVEIAAGDELASLVAEGEHARTSVIVQGI